MGHSPPKHYPEGPSTQYLGTWDWVLVNSSLLVQVWGKYMIAEHLEAWGNTDGS